VLLTPHGLLVQDVGSLATLRQTRQLIDIHRAVFQYGSTYVLNFAKMPDNLEIRQREKSYALDTMLRRPPRFLVMSSTTETDPLDVDWSLWESLGLDTEYYHASLHRQLFVIPAEVKRFFGLHYIPRTTIQRPDTGTTRGDGEL